MVNYVKPKKSSPSIKYQISIYYNGYNHFGFRPKKAMTSGIKREKKQKQKKSSSKVSGKSQKKSSSKVSGKSKRKNRHQANLNLLKKSNLKEEKESKEK